MRSTSRRPASANNPASSKENGAAAAFQAAAALCAVFPRRSGLCGSTGLWYGILRGQKSPKPGFCAGPGLPGASPPRDPCVRFVQRDAPRKTSGAENRSPLIRPRTAGTDTAGQKKRRESSPVRFLVYLYDSFHRSPRFCSSGRYPSAASSRLTARAAPQAASATVSSPFSR